MCQYQYEYFIVILLGGFFQSFLYPCEQRQKGHGGAEKISTRNDQTTTFNIRISPLEAK